MKYKGIIVLLILTLFISACSSNKEQSNQEYAPNGDLQEKTASADVLPTFLKDQREEIRLVYQAAGKSAELLQWIPCYCGCAESAGHQSSMNCFVKNINEDGSVVWDDHGTRCGICLQIAAESIAMKQEGKSVKDIRYYIDEKYKEGYAKPTNTPMPL
ncbi:PCYCGC domain-containing protein [Calidifontibacillus erzurumensis]|uniref:PCYCGC domain-containing protein n=1 Tax=Calidifontibacillus erzurumensis TaxID=2741433 RepID=A0A8J8GDT1_9BACI|nr:PCYCGC domain-containing protein [Calidifontibacillus erzurumensis]NSL51812.1 PCYCGC domain-containing protein [Calidifontibacillus erzurumensis]